MTETSYIRGAAPVAVDPRRVSRLLGLALVALLAVSAIATAAVTAMGDSSAASLRRHGVPVRAAVTTCTGISSGIGMGAQYYQCRGRYSLGGRTFEAVIRGSRAQLATGTLVEAVALPGRPSSLSLPSVAAPSSSGSYTAPIVLGLLAVAGAAGLAGRRWRSGRPLPTP